MNAKPANGLPADGTGKLHSFGINERGLIIVGVVQLDPWLSPFKEALRYRFSKAQQWIKAIDETEGGLEKFSRVCTASNGSNPKTDVCRAKRSSDSISIARTTLPIGNGRPMLRRHSLLVISVFLSLRSRLPFVAQVLICGR
jgi:hypothetical protein